MKTKAKAKAKKISQKTATADSLPENHPLRSAHWIWPNHLMYLINLHSQFRRDFVLDKVPAKAPFFITADKAYKLYVNGVFVCRGPARGYQSHWPFDEVDLASHLKAGANWISVEAYNPGISTFQYIHESSAGLLCAAKWGNFTLVSNGEWKMRRSPAHARETARYSLQIDFQEHVDARLDDRAWIFSPNPPEPWRAEIFPDGSQQFLQAPFGRPPYDTIEERGIPLLREVMMIPEKVTAHTTGKAEAGWKEWRNVSWGFSREVSQGVKWDSGKNIPSQKTSDVFSVRVEPPSPGTFRAVCVSLPEYAVGNISVAVTGGKGGEILDFQTCERMVGERPAIHDPGRACSAAMANRLILRDEETRHEFFHPLGFRVIILIVRELSSPIDVSLAVRDVSYPFEMNGNFECSDATFNDIHAISRRTQKICSLDAYVDTPWREQAQWWGD
ncbi:MAG: hypothetical protein JNM63_16225, partial [Spirochaetia bacterium]|nr:hypothetical protein [Spirochaetia bacterium]